MSLVRRYLLPGFVFQSVVIAGGYGTGREIVEFFLTLGPTRGLLAMLLVTTPIWGLVALVNYELARRWQMYDYRTFLRELLGPGWIAFEICYVAIMFIVLAVIGAAAGSLLEETFGLPYAVGVSGVLLAVGALVFLGSATIERAMAGWSLVLYAVYGVLFVWSFSRFGPAIREAFTLPPPSGSGSWLVGGVEYAAYNLSLIPVVLFALRHVRTTREAVTAGLLTGVIGIVPAVLFYVAMAGHYPAILDRPVPANFLLEALGSRGFQIAFQVVLFGTLIETGTGMIHAVNERIARTVAERHGSTLPRLARPVTALVLLGAALVLSRFGLVDLIAKGYGTLTWFFLVVYVIPVLTLGVWRLKRRTGDRP